MLHKTFKALFSLTSLCTLAAASQYNVIILNPDPDTYGSGQAASAGKQ